ncbi:hypothetical protein BGZ83_003802 [Gryganskiella cystojenkinii]|nr:hypothetical protein BGZ83_003802 [Gryganskiella cystojenkinii]
MFSIRKDFLTKAETMIQKQARGSGYDVYEALLNVVNAAGGKPLGEGTMKRAESILRRHKLVFDTNPRDDSVEKLFASLLSHSSDAVVKFAANESPVEVFGSPLVFRALSQKLNVCIVVLSTKAPARVYPCLHRRMTIGILHAHAVNVSQYMVLTPAISPPPRPLSMDEDYDDLLLPLTTEEENMLQSADPVLPGSSSTPPFPLDVDPDYDTLLPTLTTEEESMSQTEDPVVDLEVLPAPQEVDVASQTTPIPLVPSWVNVSLDPTIRLHPSTLPPVAINIDLPMVGPGNSLFGPASFREGPRVKTIADPTDDPTSGGPPRKFDIYKHVKPELCTKLMENEM